MCPPDYSGRHTLFLVQLGASALFVDLELARQTYLTAWGAAAVARGDRAGGGVLLEISHAVLDLPRRPGAPRPLDLLLDGLALLTTDGRAAATPTLQRAAKVLADIPVEEVLRWGWMATAASNAVWEQTSEHGPLLGERFAIEASACASGGGSAQATDAFPPASASVSAMAPVMRR